MKALSQSFLRDAGLLCGLVVLGVCCAAWIDAPNVKPIAAIALLGGVVFRRVAWALAGPLILTVPYWLDPTGAGWLVEAGVVVGLTIGVAIGRTIRTHLASEIRRGKLAGPGLTLVGASLTGSFAFYLISNVAWWLGAGFYPLTGDGFLACLVAGLPFFCNTLLGDLAFNGLLFSVAACFVCQPSKSAIWMAFKAAPFRS